MIVSRHLPIKATYKDTKEKLKKHTLQYGLALTSAYFICRGAEEGVSAMLGSVSSVVYLNMLSKNVDDIEKRILPLELAVPISVAMFEKIWNEAPFAFDFDYEATLFGFLVYKGALLNILYDIIKDMLLSEYKK